MAITAGITAAIGIGMQAYGTVSAASAQADASQKSADLKNQQANELMAREGINEGIMRTQFARSVDSFQAGFASTGREGAGISGVLRMQTDFQTTIANSARDAAFKAYMLHQGADIDMTLASDTATAGYLKMGGGILGAAAEAYGRGTQYKAPSTTTELSTVAAESGGGGGGPSYYTTNI